MSLIDAESFLDLRDFTHAALFQRPFWRALDRLHDYLLTLPLGIIEGTVAEGAYLINPELIAIGPGTVVEPGAYICGPCVIGANCQVRHGAYLRGDILTGNNVVLGHATEAKNAIFLNGAQAGHFAYVGDSILGNRVNLGAGTRLANFRLDHNPVMLHFGEEQVETGRRKLGAILGDRVQTGCNSVANPGTVVGRDAVIYPCKNFGGYIPPKAIIR